MSITRKNDLNSRKGPRDAKGTFITVAKKKKKGSTTAPEKEGDLFPGKRTIVPLPSGTSHLEEGEGAPLRRENVLLVGSGK